VVTAVLQLSALRKFRWPAVRAGRRTGASRPPIWRVSRRPHCP